jgi:hypothetical protein
MDCYISAVWQQIFVLLSIAMSRDQGSNQMIDYLHHAINTFINIH